MPFLVRILFYIEIAREKQPDFNWLLQNN